MNKNMNRASLWPGFAVDRLNPDCLYVSKRKHTVDVCHSMISCCNKPQLSFQTANLKLYLTKTN